VAKPTIMLYPGAGSSRDHSSLVAVEARLGAAASVERLGAPPTEDPKPARVYAALFRRATNRVEIAWIGRGHVYLQFHEGKELSR